MPLPDYTSLYVTAGVEGWDVLINSLLDLLEAQKAVEYVEVELAMNGATETAAGIFPAKVNRLGVSFRVTELVTFSGGGATFDIGDHGAADPDMYAAAVAPALNTNGANVATADPRGWSLTAQDVVLTPDVGAFTAGKVKIRAYFTRETPPVAV